MKRMLTKGLVIVASTAILCAPVEAKTVSGKVSPAAAKALTTIFPQTSGKSMDAQNSGIVISRKTGTVKVSATGNKRTISRSILSSATVQSQAKVNSRDGTITLDLTTGDVNYTYTSDTSYSLVWPVLWGICGPSVGAGFSLTATIGANPLQLSATQAPYMSGGVGCGWGCANISWTLDIAGGAREKIPLGNRYAAAELYGSLSTSITANACGVIKFTLANWTIKETSKELARASF